MNCRFRCKKTLSIHAKHLVLPFNAKAMSCFALNFVLTNVTIDGDRCLLEKYFAFSFYAFQQTKLRQTNDMITP